MTVRMIDTGNVETFEDSYAQRLLDLGYAVKAGAGQRDGSAVPPNGVTDGTVHAVPRPETTETIHAEETETTKEPETTEIVKAAENAEAETEPEKKPEARPAGKGRKNR